MRMSIGEAPKLSCARIVNPARTKNLRRSLGWVERSMDPPMRVHPRSLAPDAYASSSARPTRRDLTVSRLQHF